MIMIIAYYCILSIKAQMAKSFFSLILTNLKIYFIIYMNKREVIILVYINN